jgi:uncharacterized membrane protein
MGADHDGPPAAAPRRVRVILAAALAPLFAAAVIAAVALWPDRTLDDDAQPVPRYHATVTRIVEEPCPPTPETADVPERLIGPCGTVSVQVHDGPDANTTVETPTPAGPGAPRVNVGDEVIVVPLTDFEDPTSTTYNIADQQRGSPLVWIVALFAAAIVAFGRWRGLAALGGLAVSFAVLLFFVLPAVRDGASPLAVAVTGAALIMFVVLYLTHGVTAQTSVAVLGTLASLILTGILGTVAIAATALTGFGSEEATTLSVINGNVDLHGVLLAGIIIGSLGVLDDVTVTQAATVGELFRANPRLGRLQLYRAATRVGRAHIASTVNTIVLAYAGASLPVLLLVISADREVIEVLTSEFIAQEIVRSAVATLGLIAAVPITTALAAIVVTAGRRPRSRRPPVPRPAPDDAVAALARRPADRDVAAGPAAWEPER